MFCSQLTLHCVYRGRHRYGWWILLSDPPAISLHTPAGTPELWSLAEAKQGSPVLNLAWKKKHREEKFCTNKKKRRDRKRDAVCSQYQQWRESCGETEWGSQRAVTHGWGEKRSALNTHTYKNIKTLKHTLHNHTHTAGVPCRHL